MNSRTDDGGGSRTCEEQRGVGDEFVEGDDRIERHVQVQNRLAQRRDRVPATQVCSTPCQMVLVYFKSQITLRRLFSFTFNNSSRFDDAVQKKSFCSCEPC